jgi:hypothetical protein
VWLGRAQAPHAKLIGTLSMVQSRAFIARNLFTPLPSSLVTLL